MRSRGFTLIELLVVISIIALLSSVVLASLNSARDKARYASIVQELKQTEVALNQMYHDFGCWPLTSGSSGCLLTGGQVPLSTMIASSTIGLGKYISRAPSWPFSASVWTFDNDGDTYPSATCSSGYSTNGVKIFIPGTAGNQEHYRALNKIIDGDADPDTNAAMGCGKVLYAGGAAGTLGYIISLTP